MVLELLAYISVGLITLGWIIAMGREFIPKIGELIQKIARRTNNKTEEEQKFG